MIAANVTIDKKLTIRGEGNASETTIDDNLNTHTFVVSADGVTLQNVTFARFKANKAVQFNSNETVSNCVFTGFTYVNQYHYYFIYQKGGVFTDCIVTNNAGYRNTGIYATGAIVIQNSIFANNTTKTGDGNGSGLVHIVSDTAVMRNCTIVNNTIGASSASAAVYFRESTWSGKCYSGVYNNIIYNNKTPSGVDANWVLYRTSTAYTPNWHNNVTSPISTLTNPSDNFDLDPKLDATTFSPTGSSPDCVKTGAKTGTDAGYDCCTSYDIYGKSRGETPSIGAVQYVASSELSASINADKATARPPETILLTAVVEGAASENITYAWDIDGDGEFDDGTESTYVLNKAGTYGAVRVRVSDGTGTVTGAYDEALMVYLDVSISADATKVRLPTVITFSAAVADAEADQPFTYSWDLNGDGVEDSTEANPTLSAIGEYVNPTLLRLTDANGLMSDKIVLTGTYTVLPEKARAITVNAGESIVDVLAGAYDGDEVVLGVGTHPVTSVIQVKRPITIRGAGKKEDTILDANYGDGNTKFYHFDILSAGAKVCNLTFDRFGHSGNSGFVRIAADAVVSNVVVRNGSCGWNQGSFVQMSAGLLTHSWITNNVAGNCAGVQMGGNSTVENCAILGNRSTGAEYYNGVAISMPSGSGTQTVRNCTIAYNTFAYTNNTAVYGRAWDSTAQWVYLYNNISWSNACTQAGALHPNVFNGHGTKWVAKNNCWDYDDLSRQKDPEGGSDICTVNADPKFDAAKGVPWLSSDSPCKNAGDGDYAPTGLDIFGKPRKTGKGVDIGAVEITGGGFIIVLR